MPALSFQEEWIDALLSGSKRQTTRAQTDRIKVGDTCTLYNQQRRRIMDKLLRRMTHRGIKVMEERGYPFAPIFHQAQYYAHLLGKVKIIDVHDIHPAKMAPVELSRWAWADGFDSFTSARCWFEIRYGTRWMHQTWTVIGWDGWLERYFDPGAIA